tara:strand:+ start:1278 stop:1979 length:702 start_codon:yes stop_codon:yes gene_type:complete
MYHDFISGFSSSYINTLLFYPAFTIVHRQFYNNENLIPLIKNIYYKNGIRGFYSGLSIFSLYLPLVRGGEMYFHRKFENYSEKIFFNIGLGTVYSNCWKFIIYPINTFQINKQVLNNYKNVNFKKYWNGYTYNLYGGIISNFSWFYTYNLINNGFSNDNLLKSTLSGITASIVSDSLSHPFKVYKLLRQTNKNYKLNLQTAYRGYTFRLLINSLQGGMYGFLWNRFDKLFNSK